jgi:hypothetical protein
MSHATEGTFRSPKHVPELRKHVPDTRKACFASEKSFPALRKLRPMSPNSVPTTEKFFRFRGRISRGVLAVRSKAHKPPALELIAHLLVESVRVWSMVATGNLYTAAAIGPGIILGSSNQRASDPTPAFLSGDDEAGDPAEETVIMNKRDQME